MAKVFLCGSVSFCEFAFESFGSTEFVIPNISSMYVLWASFSFLLTECFDSRWACLSAGCLYFLYLSYKLSRLRMDLFLFVTLHTETSPFNSVHFQIIYIDERRSRKTGLNDTLYDVRKTAI